jgi:hypothetical protein
MRLGVMILEDLGPSLRMCWKATSSGRKKVLKIAGLEINDAQLAWLQLLDVADSS